ncbi:MAG: hypothetical protein Q4C70_11055 [Planctomycetia bacterium]|nr:hypothetical protein [Planctomycetia bacterium]
MKRIYTRLFPESLSFSALLLAGVSLIAGALFFGAIPSVSAQDIVDGSAKKKEKYVSTVVMPEGIRILKIDYPCHVHPTASVEVRRLTRDMLENMDAVHPVFLHKWLKATDLAEHRLCDALDECYLGDDDDMIVRELKFENPSMRLLALGWVGAFGVRDTVVRVQTENRTVQDEETTMVFPNASRTAVGMKPTKEDPFSAHAFGYDLVGADFEGPCELIVWVLRGEQILLAEQVHWEGRQENPYQEEETQVQRRPRIKKEKEDFFDDVEGEEDGDEEESGDEEEANEEMDEDSEDGDSEDDEMTDEEEDWGDEDEGWDDEE